MNSSGETIPILFVMQALAAGGAERVFLNLMKHMDHSRFQMHLVLFEESEEFSWLVPPHVVVHLATRPKLLRAPRLALSLAWEIYPEVKPDIVITTLSYANLVALLARRLSRWPHQLVISGQSMATMTLRYQRWGRTRTAFAKLFYPGADAVVAASEGVREDLISMGVAASRSSVVYNSVDIDSVRQALQEPIPEGDLFDGSLPTLVACGRLNLFKNYPLMLQALGQANRMCPMRLVILGEGPERAKLEGLIQSLKLEDRVRLLGFRKNPFPYLARGDAFVLSSTTEGLPNVIIEAMACGTAVVSTRCPSGPEEIITSGLDGLLVPNHDVAALADALVSVVSDSSLRERIAQAGQTRALDFDVGVMASGYEAVLNGLVERGSPVDKVAGPL